MKILYSALAIVGLVASHNVQELHQEMNQKVQLAKEDFQEFLSNHEVTEESVHEF